MWKNLIIIVRGAGGIALAQLRHQPARTALAICGIALAVLATTLLASTGISVIETGEQQFEATERDLWVTAGPMQLTPYGPTSVENPLYDAHVVSEEIDGHESVQTAAPIGIEAVYAGTDPDDFSLLTGVGVKTTHSHISIQEGRDFEGSDTHYADGGYDGPMTREVIVDPQTANTLNLSVGDTLFVGGSESTAKEQEFTVVGISGDFGQFLGAPTVVLRLSELQTITGTSGNDRATMISVTLESVADVSTVQTELENDYPEYDVRTNQEQLSAMVSEHAFFVGTGMTLLTLSIVAGMALTVNLLALVVSRQRRTLAALQALGISRWTLILVVGIQGLFLGVVGGTLGLVATPIAVGGLDHVLGVITGFDSLLRTPWSAYLLGATVAIVIGTSSSIVAGGVAVRSPFLKYLDR